MGLHYKDAAQMQSLVSEEFGDWSEALTIDQQMIDDYAALSGDDMWMHVDVERCAKESPYGCTIAHGFLVLSLLPKMPGKNNWIASVEGYSHMMNYGSNRLRFSGAVPVNSQIHSRSRIASVEVTEKNTRVAIEQQVNVVGEERPALIYELIMVFI